MYCTNCGVQQEGANRFCPGCGAATAGPAVPGSGASPKLLVRLSSDRKIAGVCSGLARYLGVDPAICRLATVGATLVTGVAPGLLTYLFAWIIIPVEPLSPPVAYGSTTVFPART